MSIVSVQPFSSIAAFHAAEMSSISRSDLQTCVSRRSPRFDPGLPTEGVTPEHALGHLAALATIPPRMNQIPRRDSWDHTPRQLETLWSLTKRGKMA